MSPMPKKQKGKVWRRDVELPACRLAELRDAAGLSQRELASRAGCSRTTVGNADGGLDVSLATAMRIAAVLGRSVEDIWGKPTRGKR